MDKGNKGFLNDADAEWEAKAQEATLREEWVENYYQTLCEQPDSELWGTFHDVISDAAFDTDLINKMIKYHKLGDWTGIGNLFASKVVEALYREAEEAYETRQ